MGRERKMGSSREFLLAEDVAQGSRREHGAVGGSTGQQEGTQSGGREHRTVGGSTERSEGARYRGREHRASENSVHLCESHNMRLEGKG